MKKYILSVFLLILYSSISYGLTSKEIEIVLTLEKQKVLCLNTPVIDNKPKEEIDPFSEENTIPTIVESKEEKNNYCDAYNKSIKENRKIVLWINYSNKFIEDSLPEYIHVHKTIFQDSVDKNVHVLYPFNGEVFIERFPISELSIERIRNCGLKINPPEVPQISYEPFQSFQSPVNTFRGAYGNCSSG